MSRRIAALIIVGIPLGVGSAHAQEASDVYAGWCRILFGRDERGAHRIYGGVVINTIR